MQINKVSLILVSIFFLCVNCSFDSKTGIWSGNEKEKSRIVELENDKKKSIEKIYTTEDVVVEEVDADHDAEEDRDDGHDDGLAGLALVRIAETSIAQP